MTDYENASSHIKVIYNNSNLLFAKACNQGYEISKGKYIIIGNDDIILFDNAILKLFETAESINNSASISPLFISEDRTAQEAYRRLPNIFFVFAFYLFPASEILLIFPYQGKQWVQLTPLKFLITIIAPFLLIKLDLK